MDAVAAGAPAQHHDQVAGARVLGDFVARNQPRRSGEHQRIADVARIEMHRSVDRRDAHAVAVIAHAGDHARHDAARMQRARGQRVVIRVGHAEAEDVGIGDRFRRQARAHGIADTAANSGASAAVRLNRAGMVVRFNFERQRPLVVERDHAGVVLEDRQAAAVADQFGRAEDRFLQQIIVVLESVGAVQVDRAAHRFVAAMFGPSLRDRLEFDVLGLAAQLRVMLLNRFHFSQRQRQAALLADLEQLRVALLQQRHFDQLEDRFGAGRMHRRGRVDVQFFDAFVCQQLAADAQQFSGIGLLILGVLQNIFAARGDMLRDGAAVFKRFIDTDQHRVHHAGLADDFDVLP